MAHAHMVDLYVTEWHMLTWLIDSIWIAAGTIWLDAALSRCRFNLPVFENPIALHSTAHSKV